MRICLVNYRYFVSSGPERYMFGVKDLLEGAGHEVVPFSVRYAANEPTAYEGYFVDPIGKLDQVTFRQQSLTPRTVLRSIERAVYSPEVYRKASRLIEDTSPDVAYVLNYLKKLSPSVLTAFRDHGVPIVVRFSDFALICPQPHMVRDGRICEDCLGRRYYWPSVVHGCVQHSRGASLVNALAMTYAQRRGYFAAVDAFVTPSEVMRRKMIEGGLPAERLHHIPTFVHPGERRPLAERRRRIVYAGRLEPTKGVHVLADAFALLKRRVGYDDVELVLAGEPNTRDGLRLLDSIVDRAIPDLLVAGTVGEDSVQELFAGSLLSVVPSIWYENTPNSLLESLALGTPVVASDLGSMKDMLDGTGAGLLFAPGDPKALADTLAAALDDGARLESMGEAAHALARERYAPAVHLGRLEGLLQTVATRGAAQARAGGGDGRVRVASATGPSVSGVSTAGKRGDGRPYVGGEGAPWPRVQGAPGGGRRSVSLGRGLMERGRGLGRAASMALPRAADGTIDAALIVTYRCNAKCAMCHTWQFPTKVSEEFEPALLRKLPDGLGRVNITGGEPLLRKDIGEIVDVLAPKARRLEISTNGYFTERLVEVGRKHPEITVRISLEGLAETNDRVRGTKDGFEHALRSFHALREVGVRDLGFAVTIQDDNAHDLLALYALVDELGAEFAQAVPHNSYYFHTDHNRIEDVERVQAAIRELIEAFLRSRRPKEWFRAYLNRGLVDHVGGTRRRLACTGGTDIFFLDPWGEVYPCNGWDISMGNLHTQSFDEIWHGERAREVRASVSACDRNCWMTGTAVPAMRRNLPRVAWWVARNKLRLAVGLPVDLKD